MQLCNYGCGREAKYQFKNGKLCCEDHFNKCSKMRKNNSEKHKNYKPTKETRKKLSKKLKGEKNALFGKFGRDHPRYGSKQTKKTKNKISKKNKFTIEKIQEKYLIFAKEEEMRYNPDKLEEKEIQVHCKYSECKNSKENGGWFTPTLIQFYERIRHLETKTGNDGNYLYCSEKCKQKCCLYNLRSDPNLISKFKKYKNNVYKETYKTVEKFSSKIKNLELQGKEFGYELDHKFSIYDGFINNVDPKIISHWKNLQIITLKENREKHKISSITLEELLEEIKKEKNYGK